MIRIPLLAHLAVICLAVIIGWLEAGRLAKKHPDSRLEDILRNSFHLYVLLPLFLLLFLNNLILQRMRHVFWNCPLWMQYYSSALTWGGILLIFLLMFSLIVRLAFRLRHQDRNKMVAVTVVFFLALEGLMLFFTRPLASQLVHEENKDGVIMQSTLSSCVPASAANILRVYGIEKSEAELAALFGTTSLSGTSASQVVYGMQRIGITAVMHYAPDADINKIKVPAMLFVGQNSQEDHAVALLHHSQHGVELADPLVGKRQLTEEQLRAIWQGRAVEFLPPKVSARLD